MCARQGAINPYYGSWAGSFLTGFLKKDVMLTEKVIKAAKKVNEKSTTLTEKAKEKALILTTEKSNKEAPKDKEEAFDLIKKAREIAMDLIKKAQQMALDMTEKARQEALVRAKKAKEEALDLAKKRWYGNARDLAGFLAIPRNQTKKDLTDMLCKHLDLTWGEIGAILKKDKKSDLDYYEKDKAHMVMFSDVLVNGLIKRFPKKFKE